MRSIRDIQEWLDANILNNGDDYVIRNVIVRHGFNKEAVNELNFRTARLDTYKMINEFIKWLEADKKEPMPGNGSRYSLDKALRIITRLMAGKIEEMKPELEAAAAEMGFDPDELGIRDFTVSFGEEEMTAGEPHVYRIFFASGERHEVVADDVELDDWEDEDGRVRRETVFRLDGRIVAKSGDVEFVLLDPEERDDED